MCMDCSSGEHAGWVGKNSYLNLVHSTSCVSLADYSLSDSLGQVENWGGTPNGEDGFLHLPPRSPPSVEVPLQWSRGTAGAAAWGPSCGTPPGGAGALRRPYWLPSGSGGHGLGLLERVSGTRVAANDAVVNSAFPSLSCANPSPDSLSSLLSGMLPDV